MTGTVKHRYRIAGLVALFALIAGVALVVSLRTRNRLEPPLEPGQPSVGAESPRRADLPAASESAAPAAEAPAPAAESTSEPTTELPATEPSESEPLGTASGPRAANRIDVYPGDDLVTIVNTAPEGSFIFLHGRPDGSGYTYDIGDRVLTLPNGATIRGPDATRGPRGEIDAPVKIRGSGPQIFNQQNRSGWTIEHLDISGARFVSDQNQDGVAINRGRGTVRFVKIHGNDNKGLGGWSGTLEYSELTDNSAARIPGHSAASKSIYVHSIRHSYIHHNHFHGLWTDCDNPGWRVEDNVVSDNFGTGVFNEISRGPSVIARNLIVRNNQGNVEGRAGLVVTSSKNVEIHDNVIHSNGREDVRIWEDHRAGNGPARCRSGYRTEKVLLRANAIGRP